MSVASIARRRTLARVLHEPRAGCEPLHASIARYRERAAAMTARLAELEAAGNDNARALRDALRTCSEHVEGVARLVGAPAAQDDLDWLDAPTVPRTRR